MKRKGSGGALLFISNVTSLQGKNQPQHTSYHFYHVIDKLYML